MAKFDKLNEVFNIEGTVEETVPVIHNEITLPSEEFQRLPESDKITLENKLYVKSELMSLIDTCQTVIIEQKDNLKEDAKPSAILAFGDLIRTTTDLLKELNAMDLTENNLNLKRQSLKGITNNLSQNENTSSMTITQSVTLSGADMYSYMKKFKENSELNTIDTNFKTEGNIDD